MLGCGLFVSGSRLVAPELMHGYLFRQMKSIVQQSPAASSGIKEPEMVRLLRVWELLRSEQKEDLVYLAQSMANRNRREQRSQRAIGKAA